VIKKLHDFFQQNLASNNNTQSEKSHKLATAALLLEVVYADQQTTDSEKQKLSELLTEQFQLDTHDVAQLIELAEQEIKDSSDIYQFTRLINDNYDYPARCRLIYLLWQIAIADGNIDKYEEYTIRKICDLIFVDHGDFIRAKSKALGNS
jgi:uncharacterized tellurite resistance protein B-like protein